MGHRQVLDVEMLSKWCPECHARKNSDTTSAAFLDWWEVHQAVCCVNYSGSSNVMEAQGALNIWKRSVDKHKLRYTSMIADGDSKTYATIAEAKPYGDEYSIVKHECIGHVQK